MSDIYFMPTSIPCPRCNTKQPFPVIAFVVGSYGDFICECGERFTNEYIGKYCAVIKNVKDENES